MHAAILRGFPMISVLLAVVTTMLTMAVAPTLGGSTGSMPVAKHSFCPPAC